MALPPLVHYATTVEYRTTLRTNLLSWESPDLRRHSRAFFARQVWSHVLRQAARNGIKDAFSPVRAQRIDWIKATLEHPAAALFEGWDKTSRQYDATRRVAVVYEDFVVVVAMTLKSDGSLKANFATCYQADNSISKIRTSPDGPGRRASICWGGTP